MNMNTHPHHKLFLVVILAGLISFVSACNPWDFVHDSVTITDVPATNTPLTNNNSVQLIYPSSVDLTTEEQTGERLLLSGVIYANDRATPLAGAFITLWQTDADGEYGELRAELQSDSNGYYEVTTVRPGHYQVEGVTRAAHIHIEVNAVGMRPVSTEILFEGDPYLDIDPVLLEEDATSVTARTIALSTEQDDDKVSYQGVFDMILQAR